MAVVTTGHHTQRYLRLSLAVVVAALFVSIGVQIVRSGFTWLPSISHYFYTPAHNVFVGALIAASLALVALAGRDLEAIFLNVAAIFAPLIALIPTGASGTLLASIPRVAGSPADPCDANHNCIPGEYLETIRHDVVTYTIVLGFVVVLTIVVRLVEWNDQSSRGRAGLAWRIVSIAVGPIIAVAVAIVLDLASASPAFPFNPWFAHLSVHFTATIAFFGAFTLVPLTNAIRYLRAWCRRPDRTRRPTAELVTHGDDVTTIRPWQATVYLLVPLAMIADIVWMSTIVGGSAGTGVFWGEAVALSLFAMFWVVQTFERWTDPDQPDLRAADAGSPNGVQKTRL